MSVKVTFAAAFLALAAFGSSAPKEKKPPSTPLDLYIEEAMQGSKEPSETSPSSLWTPQSRLIELGSDLRARHVDDIVTILVSERAAAVSRGTTNTSRQSGVKASVGAAGGVTRPTGPWANLAKASAATELNGEGATTREAALSTTLAARVTHVLPNGFLVVEGTKELQVNSERQIVTVRGVVRPIDLTFDNLVRSQDIAQLEVRISGRGVVGDAIRRPFFLYRLLLGIIPF